MFGSHSRVKVSIFNKIIDSGKTSKTHRQNKRHGFAKLCKNLPHTNKFCDFLPHVHVIFHLALVFCATNPGIQGLTRPNQIARRKDCSRVDDAAKFSFQQVSFVDLKSA